jgi:hypothetical protein
MKMSDVDPELWLYSRIVERQALGPAVQARDELRRDHSAGLGLESDGSCAHRYRDTLGDCRRCGPVPPAPDVDRLRPAARRSC